MDRRARRAMRLGPLLPQSCGALRRAVRAGHQSDLGPVSQGARSAAPPTPASKSRLLRLEGSNRAKGERSCARSLTTRRLVNPPLGVAFAPEVVQCRSNLVAHLLPSQ